MKKLSLLLCLSLLLTFFCAPASAASSNEFSLGINSINTIVQEGQSMILTPSYGKLATERGNNYNWSRVAVFDWSVEDDAYVLISVNTALGNGVSKDAIIPANGFVLVTNLGNNWPSLGDNSKPNYVNPISSNTYESIANMEIGTKVYLMGIDLANSTFEYEGDLTKYYDMSAFSTEAFIVTASEKPEGCYEPNKDNIMSTAPSFANTQEIYTVGDIKIEWTAVEDAKEYYICINDSTIISDGAALLRKYTKDTSVTLSAASLTVGSKITARVFALADGKASAISEYSFKICSERALDSIFRDKTVVAFGDSITAWAGWVAMMHGELGTEVINAGVGGDRTTHALKRIEKDVIAKNPDLVIVNFGMNDQATTGGKNLTPIAEYEKNYRKIIEKIQATGSDIILVAVHDVCTAKYGGGSPKYDGVDKDGKTNVDKYNEVVRKLASEYKLGFLDINTLAQDQLNTIISDGIHLSDAGQKKYCEWISNYCYEYVETAWKEAPDVSESTESSEAVSEPDVDEKSNSQTWEIALAIVIMVVGISVIGVMFAKVIIKNKKPL